jgi:hypothetical protein
MASGEYTEVTKRIIIDEFQVQGEDDLVIIPGDFFPGLF